jgi:cytochrome c biogenesis protein
MTTNEQKMSFLQNLWAWGCSLKLAIALASIATLLVMGGSLVMNASPQIFGGMDQQLMAEWLPWAWNKAPHLVFWVPLSGIFVLLFGINTLCCLIDWLTCIRHRWRKTGEYLIHTGFCLLVIAYGWNCWDGFRSGTHQLYPGDSLPVPNMAGYTLKLKAFEPQLSETGRPLDMVNDLVLLKDGEKLIEQKVRINHPLMYRGLVVLPTSMGQGLAGFRFYLQGMGMIDLTAGSQLTLPRGGELTVLQMLADARRTGRGIMPGSDRLGNPAIQFRIRTNDGVNRQGWYFLRESLPAELSAAGVYLRPTEPLLKSFSLLTINRDPGAGLAMAGGICMTIGVLLAFISFYYKRSRGDRPLI